MNYNELEFIPYEGIFRDRENALVAEYWDDEQNGFRVYDDYSVASTGNKLYWVEQLNRNPDGTISVRELGYQVNALF